MTSVGSFVAEPVLAWRAWNLGSIRGVPHLTPVGADRRPWPPGRPAEASCVRSARHRAPSPGCTCGLHGAKGVELLRRTRGPVAIGTVALWGLVIEHELGYRAEFAYPQHLRLVCAICFWWRGQEGAEPVVVATSRRTPMVPLCEQHIATAGACGFVVKHTRSAREVIAALLARYAVDHLAVEPNGVA
jgi:hypothetical protein